MNEKYLYKNIENKKVKELINRIPNEIKNNCAEGNEALNNSLKQMVEKNNKPE